MVAFTMMNLPRRVRRVAGKTGVFAVGAEGAKPPRRTRGLLTTGTRRWPAWAVLLQDRPSRAPAHPPERLPCGRLSLWPHGCWSMEPSRSGAVSLKITRSSNCKRDSQCDLGRRPMNRSNLTISQSYLLNDLVPTIADHGHRPRSARGQSDAPASCHYVEFPTETGSLAS